MHRGAYKCIHIYIEEHMSSFHRKVHQWCIRYRVRLCIEVPTKRHDKCINAQNISGYQNVSLYRGS